MVAKKREFTAEEKAAIAFVPVASELFQTIHDKLPDGTHFALLIHAPGKDGYGEVVTISTNRDFMAKQAGLWVMQTLQPGVKTKGTAMSVDIDDEA